MSIIIASTARPLARVDVVNDNLSDTVISPINASVGFRLSNNGEQQASETTGGAYNRVADWLLGGNPADYEARMTLNSGDAYTSGAVNVWLNLGTTRTWTLVEDTDGFASKTNEGLIEIRRVGTSNVLDSALIDMLVLVQVEL